MVCSHCPIPRPIQTPIKKWVLQNCVEVFILLRDNNVIEYCDNLSVSVSTSVSVSGSVNAPSVHRESNRMFTLGSDKDQRKHFTFAFAFSQCKSALTVILMNRVFQECCVPSTNKIAFK